MKRECEKGGYVRVKRVCEEGGVSVLTKQLNVNFL